MIQRIVRKALWGLFFFAFFEKFFVPILTSGGQTGVLVVLKGEIAFGGGIVRVFRGQMLDGCHTVHQPFLRLSAESS